MANEQVSSSTKKEKNYNKDSEMLDMLKSQHDLLQSFQEEIQNLRAEVRSQAASEFDTSDQGTITPLKKQSRSVRSAIPYRRLLPNLCPGTAPIKRKLVKQTSSTCWTPQSTKQTTSLAKVFPCLQLSTNQNELSSIEDNCDEDDNNDDDDEEKLDDNDERPALKDKSLTGKRHPTLSMKQQSLFEKVKLWQRKNLDVPVDKDGFRIPYMTPMIKKSLNGKSTINSSYFKTPNDLNRKRFKKLQLAPKKKEATKKRCLTSPDEGYYDTVEMDSDEFGPGIRRTLFDRCDEASSIYQDEQRAPMVEEVSEICQGCNPSLLLDSISFMKIIESSVNTCNFHNEFIKTIRQSYLVFNQQQHQQQQRKSASKRNFNQHQRQLEKRKHHHYQRPNLILTVPVPKKRFPNRGLKSKEKHWESMSVFSYRSETSVKSHATEKTVSFCLYTFAYNTSNCLN